MFVFGWLTGKIAMRKRTVFGLLKALLSGILYFSGFLGLCRASNAKNGKTFRFVRFSLFLAVEEHRLLSSF